MIIVAMCPWALGLGVDIMQLGMTTLDYMLVSNVKRVKDNKAG